MSYILLADAGSTKTSWVIIKPGIGVVDKFDSEGINPVQMSEKRILEIIKQSFIRLDKKGISEVHFFGAGCVNDKINKKIESAIYSFSNPKVCEIESDIIAAGKALFGKDEGLACILGTGSNSCLYKNGEVIHKIPSLGYILGDEGSGVSIGKNLLNGIYKKRFSAELIEVFHDKYNLDVSELVDRIYLKPSPAPFLASFSYFVLENIDKKEMQDLVRTEFESFFRNNILSYKEYQNYKIGFIGSIAHSYEFILKQVCDYYNMKLARILKSPMPSLINYYT